MLGGDEESKPWEGLRGPKRDRGTVDESWMNDELDRQCNTGPELREPKSSRNETGRKSKFWRERTVVHWDRVLHTQQAFVYTNLVLDVSLRECPNETSSLGQGNNHTFNCLDALSD